MTTTKKTRWLFAYIISRSYDVTTYRIVKANTFNGALLTGINDSQHEFARRIPSLKQSGMIKNIGGFVKGNDTDIVSCFMVPGTFREMDDGSILAYYAENAPIGRWKQ